MFWFNWFSGKNRNASAYAKAQHSEVMSSQQMDYMQPTSDGKPARSTAQPAAVVSNQRLEQRRTERNAKRELLFQVVRESMVRVGVLSSAFKFKVLSLDQRGRSFLVMVELSAEFSGEVEKLAEIENMIAQSARHRFEIVVQAVYWRYFNSSTAPTNAATSVPAPLLGALNSPISRPSPLFGMDNRPARAHAQTPASTHESANSQSYESTQPIPIQQAAQVALHQRAGLTGSFPIIGATASQRAAATKTRPVSPVGTDDLGDDEVAAFRRALATGAAQGAMAAPATPAVASAHAAKSIPASAKPAQESSMLDKARSKLLLTGYEDTEMSDDDPMPALSGTQYGDLH
jgi:hypothetical protein